MLLSLFAALLHAAGPSIDWASQPVSANETVLLLGGPFGAATNITLTPLGGPPLAVAPIQPSKGSVKFLVPPGLPRTQWEVRAGGSAPYTLNAPQLWWASADHREHATAGGYIRVFGSCVHVLSDATRASALALAASKVALSAALEGNRDLVPLAARAQAARRAHLAAAAASASLLRLTPTASDRVGAAATAPIVVQSDVHNSTAWSAWFTLPASTAPGSYTIEVANHLAPHNFVSLGAHGSYVSPQQPNVTTITVLSTAEILVRQPWKAPSAKTFTVTEYGPHGLPGCGAGGLNSQNTCPLDPSTGKPVQSQLYWANASVAIEKALAAAKAAGGGIVYFPRGTYFVNSSYGFDVPWGVQLRGEGKDLVEIIFSETYGVCSQKTCAVKPGSPKSGALALFRGPESGTGGWAVSDLTVYVTAYHNAIWHVSKRTVGFEMTRVRAIANSYFGGNGPGKGRSPAANVSWGLGDPGDMLVMLGSDFLVEDNDLYCDGTVITSTSRPSACKVQQGDGNNTATHHCHGSAWGLIRNNRLFNGKSSHFMSQWKQIIFEGNSISGISPISGGQSLGTGPGGGRAHHVFHARNRIQFVWGNDREIVTFDDAGSAYLGTVAVVSEDGRVLTLAADARSSVSGEWLGWDGAAVSVLNGTGAGTYRRVVHAGIDASAKAGEWTNPHNRTWTIDRAFGFSLTAGQVISITPARSRIIFEQDHFLDGGTLQFYGQAQECVVESLVGERMAGLIAWGQWRGWYEAPCGTMGRPPCPPPATRESALDDDDAAAAAAAAATTTGERVRLGGEMGNGIMMNTQLSYLNNRIVEGNKIVRWSAMGGGSYSPGFGKFYNGATFSIEAVSIRTNKGVACKREPGGVCHDWSELAATSAVIYRGNLALSNGGFRVANGGVTSSVRDVIIEGNQILQSDRDKAMQVSDIMSNVANGTCLLRGNEY